MKLIKSFASAILLASLGLALTFTSCSKDDEESGNASITGTWTAESMELSSIIIDGEDFVDYMVSLGATEADAQAEYDMIKNDMGDFSGTIEFREDGTYTAKFEGDDEDDIGTWSLSDDGKMLTITGGDGEVMKMDVITLTDSKAEFEMTNTETEDLDEDGDDEEMVIKTKISFTK